MKCVNRVTLMGHVGADPETGFTKDGKLFARFSLATSYKYKSEGAAQPTEKTTWHRCVVFGRLADVVKNHVRKGSGLYIDGRIDNRSWEDDKKVKHYMTEIMINDLSFVGAPKAAAAPAAVPAEAAVAAPVPEAAGEIVDEVETPF